jgi:hypothetical protein
MDDVERRALRDRLDIAEVMTRYATGIDNVSLDILRGCFADEVEIQASSAGKLHELFQHAGFDHGIKLKRDDWVNNLGTGMRSNGVTVTQHVITNHLIELGQDEAVCTSYLRAMHFNGAQFPGSPPYEVGGYYRNTLVRTSTGWKIRKWTLTCTWETGDARVLLG